MVVRFIEWGEHCFVGAGDAGVAPANPALSYPNIYQTSSCHRALLAYPSPIVDSRELTPDQRRRLILGLADHREYFTPPAKADGRATLGEGLTCLPGGARRLPRRRRRSSVGAAGATPGCAAQPAKPPAGLNDLSHLMGGAADPDDGRDPRSRGK